MLEQFRKIEDFSGKRILVTNDDGVHAPGLDVMAALARELSDDVWVVAPEVEQSGAGHSLSINMPLRYYELAERKIAVRGTPTDCTLFAYEKLLGRKVDLILSGVNRGCNLAEDITHSGTVAGAMEGVLCGVPSIAMSLMFDMDNPNAVVRWETPQAMGAQIVRRIMKVGIPPNILMNVNYPDLPPAEVKGVKMAYTGRRTLGKQLDERLDRKGRPYYWIHWGEEENELAPGSDLTAISQGYISITPINLDLTDYKVMEVMRSHIEG